MKTISHIGTLVLSLIIAVTVTAPAATVLTFGGPGYVSQGLTYTYTVGATGTGQGWSNTFGRDLTFQFWSAVTDKIAKISFAADSIGKLSVGEYSNPSNYVNAPLFFTPGFALTNQGKDLPSITNGWFKVLEIQLNEQYDCTPQKFAADFVVYDSAGQPTGGSLRWGSNIPATPIAQLIIIPEASSSFLLIGALGLIVCRRRRT